MNSYLRVWRQGYDRYLDKHVVSDEPDGLCIADVQELFWVKIEDKWYRSKDRRPGMDFRVDIITEAEYETECYAFELFPELEVTYRPIRKWIVKHIDRMMATNLFMIIICFFSFLYIPDLSNLENFLLLGYSFASAVGLDGLPYLAQKALDRE